MSLKVELQIEKPVLLLQENCLIRVAITNDGREPVLALAPPRCYTLPGIKVVNTKTGWEKLFRKEKNLFSREEPEAIPPGQTLFAQYPIFDLVVFPAPGDYELSAMWEWDNGQGKAYSEPVALTVAETRPVFVSLESAAGSPSILQPGVWVNAVGEKASLCRVIVEGGRKPRLGGIATLGELNTVTAKPALSVPAAGGLTSSQWAAWFERDTLRIGQIVANPDPALTMTELLLSPVPKLLVPPLNHVEGPRGIEGRFFLWQGTPDGLTSRFQAVTIGTRGEPEASANAPLTGAQPNWVEAAFLKDGRARTYALAKLQTPAEAKAVPPDTASKQPGSVGLLGVEWGADNQPTGAAQTLGKWEGEALAGALLIADDGVVYGAALIYGPGPAPDRKLFLQPWSHAADGAFTAGEPIVIPRAPAQHPESAQIAIGPKGEPAMLIRFKKDLRYLFREETGLKRLMGYAAETEEALALFFPGTMDPMLLGTDPETHAFLLMNEDGTPRGIPLSA